uniref:Uncharacterized protein n=1 Tax=Anguilla anguilla TaxID=7936 RepID=A0A0E9Q3W4_ANGAN
MCLCGFTPLYPSLPYVLSITLYIIVVYVYMYLQSKYNIVTHNLLY